MWQFTLIAVWVSCQLVLVMLVYAASAPWTRPHPKEVRPGLAFFYGPRVVEFHGAVVVAPALVSHRLRTYANVSSFSPTTQRALYDTIRRQRRWAS